MSSRRNGQGLQVTLDLAGRSVVVVGGSPAAARAAARYADAGAVVRILAEHSCEDVADLAADGRVRLVARDWRPGDLDGGWLVHAATGDPRGDRAVGEQAHRRRIWFLSDADGADPSASTQPATRRPAHTGPGWVALVGGGPGDPDLLTRRGHDLVHVADVVVVDRLAPRAVLAGLDPDVEIIDVGKTPGNHPVPQDEINRLLVEHARAGRRVVRLKGGDPYVFGRGGEEAAACHEAGVGVFVVPGVTSAFSVPAAAGIPVTHRTASRSVTVLTGHDVSDRERVAAFGAIARAGGTLVVLMGVELLGDLCAGLLAAGVDGATPVALVERGWTPRQRTTRTTLAAAPVTAREQSVRPPAVVVVGSVADLELGSSDPA